MFISQLFLRSPEEAALMQLAHHRYQSADTFKEAPVAGKEISLRWECPSCGAGGKEDEDRATARFTAPLAQWYSWSFDADGDRKTRHGIVAINPPQPGLLVQCAQCQAEFKIKRT